MMTTWMKCQPDGIAVTSRSRTFVGAWGCRPWVHGIVGRGISGFVARGFCGIVGFMLSLDRVFMGLYFIGLEKQ